MASTNSKQSEKKKEKDGKKLYESPAIIHTGIISSRAGSPTTLTGDPDKSGVDPADLFGNGN